MNKVAFRRIPVKSSNIVSIGHSFPRRILEVEFKNGSVYRYKGVNKKLYRALLSADSKGKALHSLIKGKFPYKKVVDKNENNKEVNSTMINNEKTAHYILDSLTDTFSRYSAFEKEANVDAMNEMEKEAKNLVERMSEAAGKVSKTVKDSKAVKGAKSIGDKIVALKASQALLDNYNSLKDTKTWNKIAPFATSTLKGMGNGAFVGAITGATSEYKDKKDDKVHRVKNAIRGAKVGAIAGAAKGAGHNLFFENKPRQEKTAHELLDEMVKEAALPLAGIVGGTLASKGSFKAIGGALKNAGGQMSKALSGTGAAFKAGNGFKNSVMNAAKATDWKGLGQGAKAAGSALYKPLARAATGFAVGEGIAGFGKGVVNGMKSSDDNMYA